MNTRSTEAADTAMPGIAKSAWASMQPHDVERFGEVILDPEERRRWCTAILIGGLPYIWTTFAALERQMFLDRLDLADGHRVLLIGEGLAGIGIDEEIKSLVGPTGEVVIVDFLEQVRNLVSSGQWPQWDWSYADDFASESFDSVAIFQGVAHANKWSQAASHLLRVLKHARPIVLGEVVFGPPMAEVIYQDAHVRYVFTKIWEAIFPGQPFEEQPYWSPEALEAAFDGLVIDNGSRAAGGVELFWGTKA